MQELVRSGAVTASGQVPDDVAWLRLLRRRSPEELAVDVLLKGPELELPHGKTFRDKDGHERHHVRQCWWDDGAKSFEMLRSSWMRKLASYPMNLLPTPTGIMTESR
jgi:hypothetical protein